MNISFISNRPGQCGVSTAALLYAATIANEGAEVLYVPVAEDNRDIMYWVDLMDKKDITVSIIQLYQMLQGGAITPNEIKRVSRNITDKLSIVDMTDTSLTGQKYNELINHFLVKNNDTTKMSSKTLFDVVIYDIHRDSRTDYVMDDILKYSNVVVNVMSQNLITNELDKDEYLFNSRQEDKCVDLSNKFTEFTIANTLINRILVPQVPVTVRVSYDNQIIYEQNKGNFKKYIKSMMSIPSVKQQQIHSSMLALNKIIQKKAVE